jgi:ribosomal protein S18 acetylase RimI-like enzyme
VLADQADGALAPPGSAEPEAQPMPMELTIRPAAPGDARVAGVLINRAMGSLAESLLGARNPDEAAATLSRLFLRRHNRFSREFAVVAERDGEPVGIVLGYPAERMPRLELPTAWALLRTIGAVRFLRMLRAAVPLRQLKEAQPGEYFLNTVAVLQADQGRGVGTALLDCFEAQAAAGGFRACSLSVEDDNARARSLYEHRGYRVLETMHVPLASLRPGSLVLRRMVKPLPVERSERRHPLPADREP